jgi:tRNA pseudouridine13 synthase
MYTIKQIPEDFIVKEVSNVEFGKVGQFTYFILKKKNYNTVTALQRIAERLRIPVKRFGFAGNKDKVALTEQMVSVKDIPKDLLEQIKLKDIEIEVVGFGNKPISLGNLFGNSFEITVRNLIKEELDLLDIKLKKEMKILNSFGEQRFSRNNSEVGKAIVKRDFKQAVELMLENDGDYEKEVANYLKIHENDFVGALRKVNKKILKLFVSAYQSKIFNQTLIKYSGEDEKIPVVGFGTELDDYDSKEIIEEIMKKENIGLRDFVIREFPELSSEGTERKKIMSITNLQLKQVGKDILNQKYKAVLTFILGPGNYATEVLRNIFS